VILLDDRVAAYPAGAADSADSAGTGGVDAFESACEAAASIVVAAARAELPLALVMASGGQPVGGDGRRHTDTRAYLDALAEAQLRSDRSSGALADATARLRQRRLGDTLIYLTGPGNPDDLGEIGALRGAYPSIVVGSLGGADRHPSTVEGLLVLAASDGADFAAAWDGVRTW
jgi:uncharacterized protein (DUF58 family)